MPPTTSRLAASSTSLNASTTRFRLPGLRWFFRSCRDDHRAQSRARAKRWRRELPSSIEWPTKASISSTVMDPRPPAIRRPSRGCSRWEFRSGPAPTRRASPATTLGLPLLARLRKNRGRNVALSASQIGWTVREALRRYTLGSAWFSGEETKKGALAPGQFADLAVFVRGLLLRCRERDQRHRIGPDDCRRPGRSRGPATFPVGVRRHFPSLPEWSPVKTVGGYHRVSHNQVEARRTSANRRSCAEGLLGACFGSRGHLLPQPPLDLGCDCFAVLTG